MHLWVISDPKNLDSCILLPKRQRIPHVPNIERTQFCVLLNVLAFFLIFCELLLIYYLSFCSLWLRIAWKMKKNTTFLYCFMTEGCSAGKSSLFLLPPPKKKQVWSFGTDLAKACMLNISVRTEKLEAADRGGTFIRVAHADKYGDLVMMMEEIY